MHKNKMGQLELNVRLRNKISSMTEKKIYKMSVINLKGKSSVDIFHPTKSIASAHC